MIHPYRIAVRYDAEFIRTGATNPQIGAFVCDSVAGIETVDAQDAEIAFRIHPIEGAPFPILQFCDRLWWPVPNGRGGSYSAADFVEALAAGIPDVLNQWSQRPPAKMMRRQELRVRRWVSDTGDASVARCQAYASKHLLLCGDAVFNLGGEPLYLRNTQRNAWEAAVVAAGSDRSAALPKARLPAPPRDFEAVQEELAAGAFALAEEAAAWPRAGEPRERIEGLLPVRASRFEVRLDAVFTLALRALDLELQYACESSDDIDRVRELKSDFVEVDQPSGDASLDRSKISVLSGLSGLVGRLPPSYRPRLAKAASVFDRFRQSPDFQPSPDDEDADDQAIGRLL